MQEVTIEVNVRQINPKALVVESGTVDDKFTTTLFSYGAPVVHKVSDGKVYIDAVGWGRSKSTSGHIKIFLGEGREEIMKHVLSGEYELVRLIPVNVHWNAPAMPDEVTEGNDQ